MPLETNISNVFWPDGQAQWVSPPTTQHAVSLNQLSSLVFLYIMRTYIMYTCCVCVCASVWRWMAFNHRRVDFLLKIQTPRTTNLLFSFQSVVRRRKMLPHHRSSRVERERDRDDVRGEDKGCERCSFCTLLADLNKRRKINNTPRGCLSSSAVCMQHSFSLSLTHTGYFSPFGARIYYYFPRHAQSYFQLLHI